MKRFLVFWAVALPLFAIGQGMWLPTSLKRLNEKDMRAQGMKIKIDELFDNDNNSLKDAVCIFGGGCTGEVVSNEGLLLTNHHCGFDAIQQLSTLEKNYLENGYWAKNRSEEMPAAGVTATFIVRMEEVSTQVLSFVRDDMSEEARQSQIDKNLAKLKTTAKKEAWQEFLVKPMYDGNQYYLYVTETYLDVRFVGAPPQSIGAFGADTDNWVWPRHTGDFSVFRIYAGKDNKPAAYSPDNQPYKPRKRFEVATEGVKEGDFTMVYGFPGRTSEYLPEIALKQTAELNGPARVALRDRALSIMQGYMRKDPKIKIDYASKYAGIANAWKKWQGEALGLKKYGAMDKKKSYEAEFNKRLLTNPAWQTKYNNILPNLNRLYSSGETFNLVRDYYLEVFQRNTEAPTMHSPLSKWLKVFDENGEKAAAEKLPKLREELGHFFDGFHVQVDRDIFAGLTEMYSENVADGYGSGILKERAKAAGGFVQLAATLYDKSIMTNKDRLLKALEGNAGTVANNIKTDAFYELLEAMNQNYKTQIAPKIAPLQGQLAANQRLYMQAQMEVFKEKKFFPDANSTLRVTYGKVKGYQPRDAVSYYHQTYLDGVMEKYVPGDYEFNVPQKLIDLWKSKDYGSYADKSGKLPVAFIATNHTTGGNSGSPVLNAKGKLIGINFDRVWEGTMSDLNYDPAICRNITVDIRYVMFMIDKFGGAGYLVEEMKR